MGRTRRGKLLIPSLIAVAVAIACGGTSVGGDGQGIVDPNGGPDSTGGRYGGGATESSGGANSIPQGGPAYAGAPTAAGGAGVFYGCPPSVPPPGSRCAMPPNGLGACPYTDSCGQSVVAICRQGGNWEVLASAMECDGSAGARNDPMLPLSCPSLRPPRGSKCDIPAEIVSYQCLYPIGCGQLLETCDQHRAWSAAETFGDCAGAGGAG